VADQVQAHVDAVFHAGEDGTERLDRGVRDLRDAGLEPDIRHEPAELDRLERILRVSIVSPTSVSMSPGSCAQRMVGPSSARCRSTASPIGASSTLEAYTGNAITAASVKQRRTSFESVLIGPSPMFDP
jgi:hypothetical protein